MQATITLRRTAPNMFATPDGAYTVIACTAEDGYRTYRVQHNQTKASAVVCYVREVRKCIEAHICSQGGTWHLHLI